MIPFSQLGSQSSLSQPSQPSPSQNGMIGQEGMFPSSSQSAQPSQSQEPSINQLYSTVAQVHSSLLQLAKQYPDMSDSVDQSVQLLKTGLSKAISNMQSSQAQQGGGVNQPSYA